MRYTKFPLFAVASILTGACAKAPPKLDLAVEEKAIREVSAHRLDLVKEHDAAGAAALFTDDAVLYRAHHDPAVGPAAIEAYQAKDATANPKAVVEWTTDVISIAAAGDMAVETGTYHLASAGLNGRGEDKGEYVAVYRKVNGQWKVARDLNASTIPEMKAQAPKPVALASAKRSSRKKAKPPVRLASRTLAKASPRRK